MLATPVPPEMRQVFLVAVLREGLAETRVQVVQVVQAGPAELRGLVEMREQGEPPVTPEIRHPEETREVAAP